MRISLDDTDFEGRTSARPWSGPQPTLDCTRCGSSLVGRRTGERRVQTTKGIRLVVETFKCGCGRRKRIPRREVATS